MFSVTELASELPITNKYLSSDVTSVAFFVSINPPVSPTIIAAKLAAAAISPELEFSPITMTYPA